MIEKEEFSSSCIGCCACSAFPTREELEVEHYGMDKVKRRVLEFLAVRQLKQNMKGQFWREEGVNNVNIG